MDNQTLKFIAIWTLIEVFFVFGAVSFYIVSKQKSVEDQKIAWTKYWVYFGIVNVLMLVFKFNPELSYFLVFAVALLCALEFFNVAKRIQSLTAIILLTIPFIIVVTLPVVFPLWIQSAFELYVAVIIFDGFSQTIGQLAKGPKLIPAISPNKTISGFLGATCMLFVSEYFFFYQPHALVYSVVVAVVSLVGDLFASYIKRKGGVKDYSSLLPGHGGFLDRFDSFLMVLAVYTIFQLLFR